MSGYRKTIVKSEEFEDSSGESIPSGWQVYSLSELMNSIKSGLSRAITFDDIGVPVITSANLVDSELDATDLKYWYEKDPQGANIADYILDDGDILLNFINSVSQIGKVCIFRDLGRPAIYTTNIFRIKPNNKVTTKFFWRLLQSNHVQHWIQLITKPAINQASFTQPEFAAISVVIPESKQEQECVTEILDTMDETIAHTSSLIAKLKQMKAGLLHDLLTRGLDENGELRDATQRPEQFKDSPLGQIPKDWETPTFEEVTVDDAPICYGIVQPGSYIESGIPVIAIQNLNTDYRTNIHKSAQAIESGYARSRVCSNDLLLSVKGTIGRVGIVPSGFIGNISRDVARIRLKSLASPQYVRQMLLAPSFQERLEQVVVGTTRPEVSIGILRKLRLPLPPLPEQELIADVFNVHDSRIRIEEAYHNKLKLQKKGLMNDLLIGKVRVNCLGDK
ncbi:restriction endonuclease subunit S [Microcoleus sp. F8-D1]